ncbi:TrkH family potassium uptake protein [Demequina sp.]|uniref:TrkH family potassium uptake protein n=1 Tax=Demequina sp. TaxID=2050685 RepID=UPI003D1381EE
MGATKSVRSAVGEWVNRTALHTPARLALGAFAIIVFFFATLLMIPGVTVDGKGTHFIDALFVSTSAVCVTGLSTIDISTHFNPWGLAIIAAAIKVGGLGIMTLASLVGLAVSRRIGLTQRILAAGEARASGLGDVKSLLAIVVVVSTATELLIGAILFPRFLTLDYGLGRSAGFSAFYAISSFNNAGFSPDPVGLYPYSSDLWMLVPIAGGVFLGALGFPVYFNLLRAWRTPKKWTLHTKLTVTMVLVLSTVSASFLLLFEWDNPGTLGSESTMATIGNVFFQSINQRSGGFSSFNIGNATQQTWLLEDVLMFIGGGSGGTAGGIRTTTLAVLLLAIWAEARGRRDMEAYGKRIGTEVLRLAVSVTLVSLFIVIVGTVVFMSVTGIALDRALYEVVSAFATCGLSTGITADLNYGGKVTLIVLMYVGRVGSLTVVAALALNRQRRVIRYPAERPLVG